MRTNNKYIIKVIALWMIDELIVFSKHTKVFEYASKKRDEGLLWIGPMKDIANQIIDNKSV